MKRAKLRKTTYLFQTSLHGIQLVIRFIINRIPPKVSTHYEYNSISDINNGTPN